MDSETERFRIDPATRDRAAAVCARLGLELSDVLREFVSRIACDGALPIDVTGLEPAGAAPSPALRGPAWTALQPQLEAETALSLLAHYIARCTAAIDAMADAGVDARRLRDLDERRATARQAREALDVTDRAAVQQILATYGAALRGFGS